MAQKTYLLICVYTRKGFKMENITSKTYRINLTETEYELFKKYILLDEMDQEIKEIQKNGFDMYDNLIEKITNPTEVKFSVKKSIAADKATEVRSKRAKAKIENAINILRMENKPITYYSISKMGRVAFTTVQKYITADELKQLN